ncbi:DUF4282 domain-containing protein [uncultured Cetobacterium sp.]|uniref:DUF4282 domain-containing protein n=1 Tax=uncultured Cetobacterium sp. TaxID=527638 RepID=UPI002630797B|nr:DUF4282 domain-containing protein [uncultured Cetobacterium sp.]
MENKFEAHSSEHKGIVNQFLKFDSFITPSIIKFIYIIGVLFFVFIGLVMIISGLSKFCGFIILVLSPFIPRILAESLIINFKILQVLQEINNKM